MFRVARQNTVSPSSSDRNQSDIRSVLCLLRACTGSVLACRVVTRIFHSRTPAPRGWTAAAAKLSYGAKARGGNEGHGVSRQICVAQMFTIYRAGLQSAGCMPRNGHCRRVVSTLQTVGGKLWPLACRAAGQKKRKVSAAPASDQPVRKARGTAKASAKQDGQANQSSKQTGSSKGAHSLQPRKKTEADSPMVSDVRPEQKYEKQQPAFQDVASTPPCCQRASLREQLQVSKCGPALSVCSSQTNASAVPKTEARSGGILCL